MKHKISIDMQPADNLYYITDKCAVTNDFIKDKFIPAPELKTLMGKLLDNEELEKTRYLSKLFQAQHIHIIQKN